MSEIKTHNWRTIGSQHHRSLVGRQYYFLH